RLASRTPTISSPISPRRWVRARSLEGISERPARSAPSPLVGEGWGGGDAARYGWRHLRRNRTTPTPNPSPQGGGERTEYGGLMCFKHKRTCRSTAGG